MRFSQSAQESQAGKRARGAVATVETDSIKAPSMVLSQGKPVSFLIPYEDMLDLVEFFDELKDKKLLGEIARARTEYAQGKAVPVEGLFKKMGF